MDYLKENDETLAENSFNAAAGKLDAFANEVVAQSGKAIDEKSAKQITELANILADKLKKN